jgi:hypothetical protein
LTIFHTIDTGSGAELAWSEGIYISCMKNYINVSQSPTEYKIEGEQGDE